MINFVDKHEDREYTALAVDGGVVLCDTVGGAFLVLRSENDLIRLKQLLEKIQITK